MTPQEFLFLLASVITGATGQYFLKLGAIKLGRVEASNALSHILRIATMPELLVGLALYGLAAIIYILLLTRVKLSVLGPSVALSYVFAVLVGYFVFRESIPLLRLVGMGFLVAGVIMLVWQKS